MYRPPRTAALLLRFASWAAIATAAFGQDRSSEEKAWDSQVPETLRHTAGFEFVVDRPDLPRVLLIGDSISIGYTPTVQRLLSDKANVHRIPVNGANTTLAMEQLDQWLAGKKWDVIHFNWGLHDLTSKGPPVEGYGENLQALIKRLRVTGARLIFATTTPIPQDSEGRPPGRELPYNAKARPSRPPLSRGSKR